MGAITKSLAELISTATPATPGSTDLFLFAPAVVVPFVTQCKQATLGDLVAGLGLNIPAKEVVFGTGTGVTSSPNLSFDSASTVLNLGSPTDITDFVQLTPNSATVFSDANGTMWIGSSDNRDSILNLFSQGGTIAIPAASQTEDVLGTINFYGMNTVLNALVAARIYSSIEGAVGAGIFAGYLGLAVSDGSSGVIQIAVVNKGGIQLENGKGLRPDIVNAHTALLQAYDVDGGAYATFATLTNGNAPDLTIAPPVGGTVTLQGSTFKSSDGSSGIDTTITTASLVGKTITVKNGLITAFA